MDDARISGSPPEPLAADLVSQPTPEDADPRPRPGGAGERGWSESVSVRSILDALPAAVAYLDGESTFRFINATYTAWFDLQEKEVLGHSAEEVMGQAWERVAGPVKGVLEGEKQQFELSLRSRNGRKFYLRVQCVPNVEKGGAQRGYFVLIEDLTAERARAAEIAWNEELLREALSSARMMAWEWSASAIATTRTANAQAVMGFVPEASPHSIADFMDKDDARASASALSEAIRTSGPYQFQFRLQRPDTDEWRWLETRARPQREPDGSTIVRGLIADITESHELTLKLRSNDDRLRLAQTVARLGTWEWDFSMDMVYCSAELARLLGLPEKETSLSLERFVARVLPEDRAGLARSLEGLRRGEDHECDYRAASAEGEVRWLAGRGRSFPNEAGEPARAVGVAVDVTEGKLGEQARERMLDELKQANAAKDQLLGMVSHELRTPLTTLRGNANILRRRWNDLDAAVAEHALRDIEQSSERLQEILSNMLNLAHSERVRPDDLEPLLLRRVLATILAEQLDLHPGLSIVLDMPEELIPILGNEAHIRQIMVNLLSNAAKYSHGQVEISLEQAGENALVAVSDDGPGIPAEEASRVFEPFFRSAAHPNTPGVGLGLTVCKRLVELQGGRMWYEPGAAGGASFRFTLPIASFGPD